MFNELHVFGQHVIVHNSQASKIEARGIPGQYVGPDQFSLGHRIWINHKIQVERNVQFLETPHPRIEGEQRNNNNRHDIA